MTAIVGVSVLRLTMYASQLPGPWIIPDELIYTELGRSAAESAAFTIRDEATRVYALLYAVVIAPAYLLWDEPESSYRAVKAINAVAMSFAAVPVYLLARRFASSGWAVAMAALAVAIPSMAYTGVVMTENLFYPLFVLAALAMVAALERPTHRRQLLLLGAIGAATLTRPQAIVILPAFASALLLVRTFEAKTEDGAVRFAYGRTDCSGSPRWAQPPSHSRCRRSVEPHRSGYSASTSTLSERSIWQTHSDAALSVRRARPLRGRPAVCRRDRADGSRGPERHFEEPPLRVGGDPRPYFLDADPGRGRRHSSRRGRAGVSSTAAADSRALVLLPRTSILPARPGLLPAAA